MELDGAQVWTTAQAAAALRVSERTVQRLARTGEIPARRHGGVWLIDLHALAAG